MGIYNVEFKARVSWEQLSRHEEKLKTLNPRYIGEDVQSDTYFQARTGRLKLREGRIENALIHYHRPNTPDAKLSEVILYRHQPDPSLKDILTLHLGIKTVVRKTRRIYFVDNVKFHFDEVDGLGSFLEVEAIDDGGKHTTEALKAQCDKYFHFFGLTDADLVAESYSDMLL